MMLASALRRGPVLRELAWVVSGKLANLVVLTAAGVLVARVCGPEQNGLYVAALSLALLLDACVGAPLDQAAVRFGALHRGEPDRVERLLAGVFRLKLSVGFVLLAVALAGATPLARALFGGEAQVPLLLTGAACTLVLLLVRGTSAFLQVQRRFRAYAAVDGAQGLSRLLILGPLLAAGMTSATAYLGAYAAGTLIVFGLTLAVIPQRYIVARWPARADAAALISFLGAATGVVVLGTITGRTDVLIISVRAGSAEAGQYAAAGHVAMILTMLAGYASVVVQPRLIPAARAGLLKRLAGWNVLGAALLGLAMAPAVVWGAPLLVPMVFGRAFEPAAPILRVLLIGTWADLVTMPILMTFGIQLVPRAAFAGEAAITLGYFASVGFFDVGSGMAMAVVVTSVRLAKLVMYLALVLAYAERFRHTPPPKPGIASVLPP